MPSAIAVIEHHSVRNKLVVDPIDKVIAVINITPKEAYNDKDSLLKIFEATKSFNEIVLKNQKPTYSIEFKEIKENDHEIYEKLCNDVLSGKKTVQTLPSLREFSTWYKLHLQNEVKKEIEKEKSMDEYFSKAKKRPLK